MKTLPLLGLAASCTAVVHLLFQPLWRWRLRKIPGTQNWPLLGAIPALLASGNVTQWRKDMADKHGPIFKMFVAGTPMVVISDCGVTRKLMLHCVDRPNVDHHVCLTGQPYHTHRYNLLFLPGHSTKFKTLRKLLDHTLIKPSSLASHARMLDEVTSRFVRHLSSFAASGEAFDACITCADMTMEGVGFAAMGLDLDVMGQASSGTSLDTAAGESQGDALPGLPASGPQTAVPIQQRLPHDRNRAAPEWLQHPPGSREFSEGLVHTCRRFVMTTDSSNDLSKWVLLAVLCPALTVPISRLANWFPDKALAKNVQVRKDVISTVRVIMDHWRQHNLTSVQAGGRLDISDKGFLSQLLVSQDLDGHLIDELDVVTQVFLMMLAGYETTASSLSMALHLLSTNPAAQLRAQQEVDTVLQGKEVGPDDLERLPYIKAVFDETLRLYPIGEPVVFRSLPAAYDVVIGGTKYRLPAGVTVMPNVLAMHHNPAYWPRPDEFLPERHIQPGNEAVAAINSQAYIPFGHGPRMCPGYRFAQLEAHLALAKLMQNFTFKPAPGCPPPKFKSGIVYSPDHVWLVAKSRKAGAEQ